jgi:hypothetical protein
MTYTQAAGGTQTGRSIQHTGTCDVCGARQCSTLYDASLRFGTRRTWAWCCQTCFDERDGHLGLGLGQQYDVEPTA